MSINYEVSCSKEDNIQRDHIQASDIGKTVVEHLNQEFELPQAIKLKFACSDDGEDSPYYDPEHKEVIVPYAFRRYVQEKLRRNEYSDDAEELRTVTDDVLLHTLYHEIGHALVDVLNLPITGKEEDAVDELSTVLLLESYEDGDEIAISAGEFFDIEALQTENVTEDALFGEHSLDEQRFFNILCLVYGENPEERTDLFEGLDINEERAEMCIDDFEKRNKAWATLLKLYRKPIE
jgi:hypothetical protein